MTLTEQQDTLELAGVTYTRAPLTERLMLEQNRLAREQGKLGRQQDRLMRKAAKADDAGDEEEAERLYDEAEALSDRITALDFELFEQRLRDPDGNPPPRDVIDYRQALEFFRIQRDGAEQDPPSRPGT